MQIRIKT